MYRFGHSVHPTELGLRFVIRNAQFVKVRDRAVLMLR